MATRSAYQFSYTTMSGCDIKATFGGTVIGELQAVSVQVTREKTGIYTMGSPSPRSFSRGKRGIAGSLIFIQFDRDPLLWNVRNLKFQADSDEIKPEWQESVGSSTLSITSQPVPSIGVGQGAGARERAETATAGTLSDALSDQVIQSPWYADQVPPFDIVLVGSNEYGDVMKSAIIGVELLNEGWGVSVDDMVMEKQYTYVARDVQWWQWVDNSTKFNEMARG